MAAFKQITLLILAVAIMLSGFLWFQPTQALDILENAVVASNQERVIFRIDADEDVSVTLYINWNKQSDQNYIPYTVKYPSGFGSATQFIKVEGVPENTKFFSYVVEIKNRQDKVFLTKGDRGEIGIEGNDNPLAGVFTTQAGEPGPIPGRDGRSPSPDDNPPGSDFPQSPTTPTTTADEPEDNVVFDALGKILKTLKLTDQPFPGLTNRFGFSLALLFFVLALTLEIWYLIHRARPWGIVYDSQTKIPVQAALIRVFDKESNRLLETKTTDENGRFSLIVKPGKYFIEVQKEGYHFPSRLITTQDQEYFPNVYRGELIKSQGDTMVINVSIPIDSRQEKSAIEKTQTHWKLLLLYRWRRFIILMLTLIIFILFWLFRIPLALVFILLLWLIEAVPRWKSIYGGNG